MGRYDVTHDEMRAVACHTVELRSRAQIGSRENHHFHAALSRAFEIYDHSSLYLAGHKPRIGIYVFALYKLLYKAP